MLPHVLHPDVRLQRTATRVPHVAAGLAGLLGPPRAHPGHHRVVHPAKVVERLLPLQARRPAEDDALVALAPGVALPGVASPLILFVAVAIAAVRNPHVAARFR